MATKKQTPAQTVSKRVKHHVKHAVVPLKGNQYRPHLIRWQGISIVLAVIVAMQFFYGFVLHSTGVLARVSSVDTAQLLDETNMQRELSEAQPLVISPQLTEAANLKAQDMVENNYWAHTSPDGDSPWKWLRDVDYAYNQAGENLAKNYPNATSTVDAWMTSTSHRENMLDPEYTEAGFATAEGVIDGKNTTVIVAYYAAPYDTNAALGVNQGEAGVLSTTAAPLLEGIGNPIAYTATAFQSLSPVTLISIGLLIVVAAVSLVAHQHRHKLPVAFRKSWRAHHGMYIFIAAVGMVGLLIISTGGGQI